MKSRSSGSEKDTLELEINKWLYFGRLHLYYHDDHDHHTNSFRIQRHFHDALLQTLDNIIRDEMGTIANCHQKEHK